MFKPGTEFGIFYASKTAVEVSQNTDSGKTAETGSNNSQVLANMLYTHNLLPTFNSLIWMLLFAMHYCSSLFVIFGMSTSFWILSGYKSHWNKFIFRWPNQNPSLAVKDWWVKLALLCSFKILTSLWSKTDSAVYITLKLFPQSL